jgi:serine/threonine protein kinase
MRTASLDGSDPDWLTNLSLEDAERSLAELALRTEPSDPRLATGLYQRITHVVESGPIPARAGIHHADTAELLVPPARGAFAPYRVVRELGKGGMGVVLEVEHARTGERYALKTLRPEESLSSALLEAARSRLRREVDLNARLDHPHVIHVHAARLEGDTPFVVLDLLLGGSLAERLEREGPLPIPAALELARSLGLALHHAHERGVLHRDLKPENVIFDTDGRAVLVDFGLAMSLHASGLRFTRTGEIVGTPAFLAPEQIREGSTGNVPSVDVYGLGALVYNALTGELPVPLGDVTNVIDALRAVLERPPTPLRAIRPEITPPVQAFVLSLLTKDPAERPTLDEALVALNQLCPHQQQLPRSSGRIPVPPSAAQLIGQRFDGYEVVEFIAEGGMGTVFRVRDSLGRDLALKRIKGVAGKRGLARFQREGQLSASLRHPGIVRIHAAGVFEGAPYQVYELVEGASTLAEKIAAGAPRRELLAHVLEVARAVAFAHERGIVHRDLKPENILVDRHGHARVLDFGLGWREGDQVLTVTGATLGTPAYASPEQLTGKSELARRPTTDVWSLGVILYECLTRRLPFAGHSLVEQMHLVQAADPAAPRSIDPSIPLSIERLCLQALNAVAGQRPANAGMWGEALAGAIEILEVGTTDGPDLSVPRLSGSRPPPPTPSARGVPRSKLVVSAAALVCAALLAGVWALAYDSPDSLWSRISAYSGDDETLDADLQNASTEQQRLGYAALALRGPEPRERAAWELRLAHARRAVELSPKPTPALLEALIAAELATDAPLPAAANLALLRARGDTPQLALREARARAAGKDIPAARTILDGYLASQPSDLRPGLTLLVELHVARAAWVDAGHALRRLARAWRAVGLALVRRTPEALITASEGTPRLPEVIRSVLSASKGKPLANHLRFELLTAVGEVNSALSLAAEACESRLDPKLALDAYALARAQRGAAHATTQRWLQRLRHLPSGAPHRRLAELEASSSRLQTLPPPAAWAAALAEAPQASLAGIDWTRRMRSEGRVNATEVREALLRLRELWARSPLSPHVALSLSDALIAHYQTSGAADALYEQIALLRTIQELTPMTELQIDLGRDLILLGRPRAALAELERWAQKNEAPGGSTARMQGRGWLVAANLAAGNKEEAARWASYLSSASLTPAVRDELSQAPRAIYKRMRELIPELSGRR